MNAKQLSIDVITYAKKCDCPITNLKLQKTLYYIQGYYGRYFEKPLFEDDIEHWPYGPVVPVVYFEYCPFGADEITVAPAKTIFADCEASAKKIIINVIDKCLSMTARELVDKTHKEAPWLESEPSGEISFSSILQYFKKNNPLGIKE